MGFYRAKPSCGCHAVHCSFNLGMAKVRVIKAIEGTVPAGFIHFYQGPLFDRLLHGLILYFCALFQHEALVKCMDRSRQQHLEGTRASLDSSICIMAAS